ncbi:hypothetical protein BDR05DRAFT_952935 [Suillus weaverae]|nr:hypothetical protein BDR05DRAFT_952935 [Suillus weaverae]
MVKSHQFKVTLDDAWTQINDAMKTIASAHHKSICCVQNDLYIGHGKLHSRCSKVNVWNMFCWKKSQDSDQGRHALEQLVYKHKAKYHMLFGRKNNKTWSRSAETILYMMHGSTDLPLQGVTFAMEGVQHFMHKMKGFAVQGMRGGAKKINNAVMHESIESVTRKVIM